MELIRKELVGVNCIKNVIKFDRKKGIVGIILALIVFLSFSFLSQWCLGVLYATAFLLLGFFRIEVKNTTLKYLLNALGLVTFILAMTFVSYSMINRSNIFKIPSPRKYYNYICILIVYILVFIATAKWKKSIVISSVLLMFLVTANTFVYQFRGKEMSPFDIFSVGVGISVMGEYIPECNIDMIVGWTVGILSIFFQFSLPTLPDFKKMRVRLSGLCFGVILYVVLSIGASNLKIKTWGVEGSLNGYYLNFYLAIRDSAMKKPNNYNINNIKEMENKYSTSDTISKEKKLPNIIVIMDESFADFRVFGGELKTNKPVTPFIDSIKENAIKGYALSSVYGGETANSEFEFLTGHSMAFLPNGTVPYQQYINRSTYSLAWLLNSYGYESFATHPYGEKGWSRETVYPDIGFKESTFYESYPKKHFIRNYISDKETFEYIIDKVQEKEKPLFLFGITMQNHGGYTYTGKRFEKSIELEGYKKEYPKAEQYLSLIHETDKAVQYLISSLEDYEEDTIVLFFGDHFPRVENELYEELLGKSFDEINEQILKYKVPFFIWANYDIEEAEVELTSLNFLSQYLLSALELNQSSYSRVISEVCEAIPAMNSMGYYSKEQEKFIKYKDAKGKEAELLNKYAILQYNSLFDKKYRSDVFFENYIEKE